MKLSPSMMVVILTACVFATVAVAHSGVKNPAVRERMDLMKSSQDAMDMLVRMAKGEAEFDPGFAGQARQTLILNIKDIPLHFRNLEQDLKSDALPVIWENWADFEAKSTKALDVAVSSDVSTFPKLREGVLALGGQCLSCHRT